MKCESALDVLATLSEDLDDPDVVDAPIPGPDVHLLDEERLGTETLLIVVDRVLRKVDDGRDDVLDNPMASKWGPCVVSDRVADDLPQHSYLPCGLDGELVVRYVVWRAAEDRVLTHFPMLAAESDVTVRANDCRARDLDPAREDETDQRAMDGGRVPRIAECLISLRHGLGPSPDFAQEGGQAHPILARKAIGTQQGLDLDGCPLEEAALDQLTAENKPNSAACSGRARRVL